MGVDRGSGYTNEPHTLWENLIEIEQTTLPFKILATSLVNPAIIINIIQQ
jgi:hypothetical protein